MSTLMAAALLFGTMERDDIQFCEKLGKLGYTTHLIGTIQGENAYQFTPRRVGENATKDCDLSLEQALGMNGFDVLIIPGGPGAYGVENVEGVRQLVEKAKKVVAFGYGVALLANTGHLNGKNATTDDHFFFGVGLSSWKDVHWQRDPPFVSDGKFITSKFAKYSAILPMLAPEGTTADVPSSSSPSSPHLIDQISGAELTPWQTLIKRLRDHARHLVDQSDVPVDQDVLENYPFLRPSAPANSIAAAETKLGIPLPQDYKDFFSVTNGTGFSGTNSIPGLVAVEDLEWASTDETGLEGLTDLVDVPGIRDLTPQEQAALPALQRVLIISDPDDEETVGMFDPAYIRQVIRTVREIRQLPLEDTDTVSWITFLFVPYAASYKQFDSFKGYVESRLPA